MCGIGGFFGNRPMALAQTDAMLAALAGRGPDAQHMQGWDQNWNNTETAPSNALIHARLSIRDLSHNADQPMGNENGDVWICYNGEVYGWEPLREDMQQEGHVFHTSSDTEFILHAYQKWGLDMLPKLRGMFAIAILDKRINKLFLIRDRMGLKPLLYWHQQGDSRGFGFSSLIRGLLPYLPQGQRRLSDQAIDAYLAHRYIPAPLSIIDGVQRLENGHYLELDLNDWSLNKQAYWFPESEHGSFGDTLDEAIDLRTVSDRPVGLFLSGGIDSTVLASRLTAAGHSNITCFTARFSGSELDESRVAVNSASKLGMPHVNVDIPKDIDDTAFARIVSDLDDPFADPSSFPMWYLSEAASREVKVVLGGDGGDELFAGYKRYHKHLRSQWRRGWKLPGNPFKAKDSKNGKLISELKAPWIDAYALRFSGFTFAQRANVWKQTPYSTTYWRDVQSKPDQPALHTLLQVDLNNYLPEYILRKGDLCTMAHGLEMRCPLIDQDLYQQILALPEEKRFTTPAKQIFKPFAAPVDDVFRLKKRGFNPPLKHWLRACWQGRYRGLGTRLEQLTANRIQGRHIDDLVHQYLEGNESLAERILQLLILDESLTQLVALGAET